jgi:hypothetical protein
MVAVDEHPPASAGRCALGKLEIPSGFFWVARDINALDGALAAENAVFKHRIFGTFKLASPHKVTMKIYGNRDDDHVGQPYVDGG